MTASLRLSVFTSSLLLMSSFSHARHAGDDISGHYSTSAGDPSQISLILNNDHTYSFRDYSDPTKKIDLHGRWIQKGKAVVLDPNGSSQKFHNKWKFTGNGMAARSRKGLSYYRICRN